MSESPARYLHDHSAGSRFAAQLVEMLAEAHTGEALGNFASKLHGEVLEDKAVLQSIIDRVGTSGLDLKEAAGWLAEKVSELRLRRATSGQLGTLEALEMLELGIHGKLGLWRVLKLGAAADERLQGVDYDALIARAEKQHAEVEQFRLSSAEMAFGWQAGGLH